MNQRPTSFLLRDKITFSEQESRRLRLIHKLQKRRKHQNHIPPEFNYGTDETQTEIIPDIEPELAPIDIPPTSVIPPPFVIPSVTLTPDVTPIGSVSKLPPRFIDLSSNPTNGGVRVNLGDLLPRKTKGAPIDTRNVDSMMEDAKEILAALGL